MYNKFNFLVIAMICLAGTVFGQEVQPCGTDEHHHRMLKLYPQLAEYERQFNEQVNGQIAAKTTGAPVDTAYYDVPIVVHIVHDYGSEYLKDDDIYDAVANWSLAFVKKNLDTSAVIAPFKPYIGNARIRLHLATIDPNGNPTKGVVRHHSYLTTTADDQAKFESWPNNKYINIWFINSFGSSGAAAYAYYPSSGATMPHYDGVISLASYLNTSKTIPHELGHVLNLAHVWGNNNNAAVACGNDGVDDTPPTKGHTPGCNIAAIYDTTCSMGYMKTYTSITGLMDSTVNYPDTNNSQNIMDYTYCANMFSIGQCVRMRNALTSSVAGRNNLISSDNVAATGALAPMPDLPPVADYTMNRATGPGSFSDAKGYFLTFNNAGSFSFRNASWNDTISSVHWEFSNGATVPTSTSTASINNKFSVPGWVTVKLTAVSNAGSNTIVNPQAVYAADTTVVGGMGYSQTFATEGDILNWPMFNYFDNQFKWEFYNGAGKGDNSCIRFRSFDTTLRRTGRATGDYDDIYTPAFNLNGVTEPVFFNFFSAGASTSSGVSGSSRVLDSMQVDVSITGGASWVKLTGFRGTDLANNGNLGTNFIPSTSSTWKARSVAVPATYRTGQTFFRLRYRAGSGGNNLYVDNMSISNLPSELQEVAAASTSGFTVYPNPSADGSYLLFNTGNDASVRYIVRDITGKVVLDVAKDMAPNVSNKEFIARSAMPSAGMYFVTLTTGGSSVTQKMVIY